MRRSSKLAALIIFAAGARSTIYGQGETAQIDLLSSQSSEIAVHFTTGSGSGGGIGTNGKEPPAPVLINLGGIDLSDCQNGEARMDIRITNMTSSPMVLPWSLDGARTAVVQGDKATNFETLSVIVHHKADATQGKIVSLYASQSNPQSQVTIPPGQSVLLRNYVFRAAKGTKSAKTNLCDQDFRATVILSSDRAQKVSNGSYSLDSNDLWVFQSQ